jgi:hypothetical protein
MAMDFKKATDELFAPISHDDLAAALGKSVPSIRQARLDEGASAHRKPPEGWEKAVAGLAEKQANRLIRLSKSLKTSK